MHHQVQLHRAQAGQGLLEGVVGLILIISGSVLATLLLANVGLSTYYKEKLGFVCNQAASYAFLIPRNQDPTAQTTQFVNNLMSAMGLPVHGNPVVTADNSISISGKDAVKVTINANMNLLGQGNILPLTVPISESTVATSTTYVVSGPAGPPGPAGPAGAAAPAGGGGGGGATWDNMIMVTKGYGGGSPLYVPAFTPNAANKLYSFNSPLLAGNLWGTIGAPSGSASGIALQPAFFGGPSNQPVFYGQPNP